MKTGIIYGSNNGNTQAVSEKVAEKLDAKLFHINNLEPEAIGDLDFIIFATSTWGIGDLCDDWELGISKVEGISLTNKYVSFIGLGDQMVYGSTFCDGLRLIYDRLDVKSMNHVGKWSVDDYDFEESQSIVDGQFLGLVVDEDNESDLTDQRVDLWVRQVKSEIM